MITYDDFCNCLNTPLKILSFFDDKMSYKSIVENEFPSLKTCAYMDFAGAMPLSLSQSRKMMEYSMSCLTSPHSKSQLSPVVNEIEALRSDVCDAFGTNIAEYAVVFLQNTTHAFNLLSEIIPYDEGKWKLNYLIDNHNSAFGFRTRAQNLGVDVETINGFPNFENDNRNSIFLYPFMSNFCGKKYPLEWCSKYQQISGNNYIILDCASTTIPQLNKEKPDFVVASLLKITGINGGILMIRRDRIGKLKPLPPAGGTVVFTSPVNGAYKLLPRIEQQLEQGTPPYINLLLAKVGFQIRKALNGETAIINHINNLSKKLEDGLRSLHHSNGAPLIKFVPERDNSFGSNFSFNIYSADGEVLSHRDINYCFFVYNIIARTGTHCNTMVLNSLGWDDEEVEQHVNKQVKYGECFGDSCIIDNRPVGTVRLSLGMCSSEKDVNYLLNVLKSQFIDGGPSPVLPSKLEAPLIVKRIFVYPILGAHGFEVTSWPVSERGLAYDRFWKLVTADGVVVNLNQNLNLSSLFASIKDNSKLVLTFKDDMLELPINDFKQYKEPPNVVEDAGLVYDESVCQWLYEKLGMYLFLVKSGDREQGRFAFSCVGEGSMRRFESGFDIRRLRVNILFGPGGSVEMKPFAEQGKLCGNVRLGSMKITRLRPRTLCVMTTIVPMTGEIDREPLKKLSEKCGHYGTVQLGSLFSVECPTKDPLLSVGDSLIDE